MNTDIKTGHVGWSPDYDSSKDPDNLEGPPPTREERAAMARELDAVAPTPADKFALMFGAGKTPRTDAAKFHITISQNPDDAGVWVVDSDFARQLELGLAEALEALRQLHDAADVYAADQSGVTDERCGLVQPVTAEDGRRLNEALVVAHIIINRQL